MCADVAIHNGEKENGIKNPHVHILLTDRPINQNGFCANKNRTWNNRTHVRQWRELWEKMQNREFERKGLEIRVSCQSFKVQGIDREPTKHMGRKATEMERRGKETERGKENRIIEMKNQEREHKRQLERQREHEHERARYR